MNSTSKPRQMRDLTPDEKLELARELNRYLDRRMDELSLADAFDLTEVLVLALYARTSLQQRRLFLGGIN